MRGPLRPRGLLGGGTTRSEAEHGRHPTRCRPSPGSGWCIKAQSSNTCSDRLGQGRGGHLTYCLGVIPRHICEECKLPRWGQALFLLTLLWWPVQRCPLPVELGHKRPLSILRRNRSPGMSRKGPWIPSHLGSIFQATSKGGPAGTTGSVEQSVFSPALGVSPSLLSLLCRVSPPHPSSRGGVR